MQYLKVATVSLNQTPLDWAQNKANILQAIQAARKAEVTVLCCPELCITGYGCEDMFFSTSTVEQGLLVLQEIVENTKNIIVAVGLPLLHHGSLFNTACLIINQKIVGFVAKQHLANTGIHYESRWFKAWPANKVEDISINGNTYLIGDLVFELEGFANLRLGFEICEDAWVPERTGLSLAKRGVDLILNPSASHFAFGKSFIRKRLVKEGSRVFGVGYLYANLLGLEAGRIIYSGDTYIAAAGEMLSVGRRFSFKDFVMSTAILDIENLRLNRQSLINPSKILPAELDKTIISVASTLFKFKQYSEKKQKSSSLDILAEVDPADSLTSTWEEGKYLKEEEFMRATALGLFDYLRKSHAQGFVLNLSGGADSATCACLVYSMLRLSLIELGEEGFQKKLPDIFFNTKIDIQNTNKKTTQKKDLNISFYLKKLFYCIYQQTKNSTETTLNAAFSLSAALDFPLFNVQIDSIIETYSDLIQPVIGRALDWKIDDISMQNIQSRARGPSAWMLANVRRAILLCTSNRSEASVGYTTMDGDTCGGLSPLAGVDKHFILQWLQWLEKTGPLELGAIKALKAINSQLPTAELRPQAMMQTDEADLMSYDWLDRIERFFVRDKKSPKEILVLMEEYYPQESKRKLAFSIECFFKRWAENQWKRERLAPAFHVDDENIDPKTGCRFPILSGGFKEELAEMWSLV